MSQCQLMLFETIVALAQPEVEIPAKIVHPCKCFVVSISRQGFFCFIELLQCLDMPVSQVEGCGHSQSRQTPLHAILCQFQCCLIGRCGLFRQAFMLLQLAELTL